MAALVVIRRPHRKRSQQVLVTESRKSILERFLMSLMTLFGLVIPLVYVLTPLLSFANYPLRPVAFPVGIPCDGFGGWLFYRAHRDLGTNWSPTLELRENHQLVASGIYKSIRHPMYAAIYLGVLAQGLLLFNWIAGLAGLAAFTLMFTLRVPSEERMLVEQFGEPYQEYMLRTKRLIPGIW